MCLGHTVADVMVILGSIDIVMGEWIDDRIRHTQGHGVTARNFVGSFYDNERLTTIQYPEERAPLPENYRNFPFLFTTAMMRTRAALCRLPDLREGMPAAVHLHRQE
jgi:hypothetical protein